MAKALNVEKVSLHIVRTKSDSLAIWAVGSVTSSGWTNARLSPYYYITPPADGIYDFDLEATPPTGIALAVISPIAATLVVPTLPSWLKGVRIHASANNLQALLPGEFLEIKAGGISLLWDGHLPWPDVFRASGFDVGNG